MKDPKLQVAEDNLVFQVVTGSTSYGVAVATSDQDLRGAFVPPPKYILCNGPFREYDKEPIKYSSILKFTEMLVGGKPNFVELLFGDPQFTLKQTVYFEELLKYKNMLLTKTLINTGRRMSKGLCERAGEAQPQATDPLRQEKQSMHGYRVALTMLELLKTGVFRVYRPDERELLLPIRLGHVPLDDVEKMVLEISDEIESLLPGSIFLDDADEEFFMGLAQDSILAYWKNNEWL